jgi:predicted phage terminase large subunit-like protein
MSERSKQLLENFFRFVAFAFYQVHGCKLGFQPYIMHLCLEMMAAVNDGARIIVNMPPRHLKSFVCTVCLVAWLLARDPREKILLVCCSDNLADELAHQIRSIIESTWYQRLFETRLAHDRRRVRDFKTTDGGGVYAVSIGGKYTGRGASIIIVDDPLDIKDAGNIEQIEKVNGEFTTATLSRLNDPRAGRVVIVAHRLNKMDLSGFLLEAGGYHQVALPFEAIEQTIFDFGNGRTWTREPGDILRPGAFGRAEIELYKTTIKPGYEALYQQFKGVEHTVEITGDMLPLYPGAAPAGPVTISVDPGHTEFGRSYTVMQAWASVDGINYLLDQWRGNADFDTVWGALRKGVANGQARAVLVETTGFGQVLLQRLRQHYLRLDVKPVQPGRRSKVARLLPHIDTIRGGKVRIPDGEKWTAAFIDEMVAFPNGEGDDQIDALTQYLDFVKTAPVYGAPTERPAVGVVVTYSGARYTVRAPYVQTVITHRLKIFPHRDDTANAPGKKPGRAPSRPPRKPSR